MTEDRPLLTVVIPTIGRASLIQTLDSLSGQGSTDDVEVIVVGDTLDGPLPAVEAVVTGRGFRYLGHAGQKHCWGQPQRQAGMDQARGRWVLFGADDNIWTPGSFDEIRAAIGTIPVPVPLLFRARVIGGMVVWRDNTIRQGNIDADCIVAPNVPERLGSWGFRYEGDYDFVRGTVDRWNGKVVWCHKVISLARPSLSEQWMGRGVMTA